MNTQHSVTHWLEQLKDGDQDAAQELWNRYFRRLIGVARKTLGSERKRVEDEDDVVVSAMNSFFQGARAGKYPELRDRDNLWPLLFKITERKAIDKYNRELAQKRGGGRVRGDSALAGEGTKQGAFDELEAPEPTPANIAELREECQRLFDLLDSEPLCRVATLKLHGFKNREIAKKLGVSVRSVERKMRLIRKQWSQELGS